MKSKCAVDYQSALCMDTNKTVLHQADKISALCGTVASKSSAFKYRRDERRPDIRVQKRATHEL